MLILMQVTCHFCNIEMDSENPTIYRRATGWVRKGMPPVLIAPPTAFACKPCVDLNRGKIAFTQSEKLF